MPYERTQHAIWMWFVLIPIVAILAGAWFQSTSAAMLVPLAVVWIPLVLVLTIFTRLTIAVDANAVSWHFGWGWPGGAIRAGRYRTC